MPAPRVRSLAIRCPAAGRARRPARLPQRTDGGLDCLEDLAGGHQGGHGVVVGVERPVDVQVVDVAADDVLRGAHARAGLELAEVERLSGAHELDPQHAVGVLEDLAVLERGVHAHGDEIFLIGCGRDAHRARGRRQDALLRDEHVGGVLAEHHTAVETWVRREEVGQALARRGILETVEPAFAQHADHGDRLADDLHRQADRRALEVGARKRELVLGYEDGVVADAVELDLHLALRPGERVVSGADDLRRRPHRVGVLHLGLDLAGGEVAVVDALLDRRGAADRAGEAAQLVQSGVVRLEIGEQRLEAHGTGDLGLAEPAVGVPAEQRAHRGEDVGAVDGGEAVARLQPRDGDAGALHGLAAGQALTLEEGLALAHHEEGELGHRGEVAGGAHRALLADHGRDTLVQHLDERHRNLGAVAGVAVRVHVDAPRHGGAHDLERRRLADAGGVVVDEKALELLDLLVVEHDLAELADARVGAVHALAGLDLVFDHGAARLDALERRRIEPDLLAVAGDADDLLDGERRAVQDDGHRDSLPHACGAARSVPMGQRAAPAYSLLAE